MYRIVELKRYLPYYIDGLKLRLITKYDIDRYLENFTLDYMNEFIDTKVHKDKIDVLKFFLNKLIFSYKCNSRVQGEARLILENNNNEMVAGITLYEKGDNSIELGYWVLPTYQNKGIAKKLVSETISIIKKLSNIKFIILEIREDNTYSHKVAKDNNFKLSEIRDGLYKKNYIYILEI